jgi:hypothetical protein
MGKSEIRKSGTEGQSFNHGSTRMDTGLLSASFAQGAPADDIEAAIKKLANAPNYSWTATTVDAVPFMSGNPGAIPVDISPDPINGKLRKLTLPAARRSKLTSP